MQSDEKKGEITAFLSLIFLLLLSFAGAMIESASIQVLKNNKYADASLAMESVFAEYQKEVLEEYDLFVLDGSYDSGEFAEDKILRRLDYYGADVSGSKIEKLEFLTDGGGRAFYEQAVRYIQEKTGIHAMSDETWETPIDIEEEAIKARQELETILEESGEQLPKENNPIQIISDIRNSAFLKVLVSNEAELSNNSLKKERLSSVRKLREGRGRLDSMTVMNDAVGRLAFQSYLLEHFSDITQKKQERALDYELEYLIAGCENDKKNLEIVTKKIAALRCAVNYAYLLTDEEKRAEAKVMAVGLCVLLTVPGITEAVKQALLLAWAYGESIVELRTLISGKRVPFVKTKENWQLQLSALLHLTDDGMQKSTEENEKGMSYRDYLKTFLVLEKKETLSMRALDLIESNLNIKADDCVVRMQVAHRCQMRRGIQYEFSTYFGYQ